MKKYLSTFAQLFFAVSGAGSGTVIVLIMTELMGLYAISSVVLIRKQLPLRYRYAFWCCCTCFLGAAMLLSKHALSAFSDCRAVITDALGGELEFEFFHRWFNTLFLVSALLTILLFYVQHRQSRDEQELPLYTHQA